VSLESAAICGYGRSHCISNRIAEHKLDFESPTAPDPSGMDHRDAVIVVSSSDEEPQPRGLLISSDEEPEPGEHVDIPRQAYRFYQWAPHHGHGLCKGFEGEPCTLGEGGRRANAGVDGVCDLCNVKDMPLLHRHGQGRLTHLLLHVPPEKAELVLGRLQAAEGEELAAEVRHRLERTRRRNRADRPRRGPRGPYKKRRTLAAASADPPMPEEHEQNIDHETKDDEELSESNNSNEAAEDECDVEGELHEPAEDDGSDDEDESAEDLTDTSDEESENDEAEFAEELGEMKNSGHEAKDEPSEESPEKHTSDKQSEDHEAEIAEEIGEMEKNSRGAQEEPSDENPEKLGSALAPFQILFI